MKTYATATNSLSTSDRLNEVNLRPDQIRRARAALRQAEMIADMLMRANDDLRRAFGLIARAVGAVARRSKASAATPEWKLP